ncbi:MAG TPA: DNRLRE domain-containing protein, partial [Polyangiaceae bacterium]|nr:DNRLRE domain-containing protein [Polyangiaceae bacterium]
SQTLTLTQGVGGYSGVTDGSISNLYYSASDPNGTSFTTNDELYAYTIDYTTKALLKFDLSQIPAAATVLSASLALTIESWTSPQALIGNFLATPWNESGANFGWTDTGSGAAWSSPGIGSADTRGPSFQFAGIDASGDQQKTVALDVATVQGWLRDASTNDGLVLSNQDTGQVLRIYSSKATDPTQRPALSVTYD